MAKDQKPQQTHQVKPQQPAHQPPKRPHVATITPPTTIVPPAVPPAPLTHAEIQDPPRKLADVVSVTIDASKLPPRVAADPRESIAQHLNEGRALLDAPPLEDRPPTLDNLDVEDLPPISEAQKAEEDRLMAQLLAEEEAGRAPPPPPRPREDVILIHNTTTSAHGIALPVVPGEKRNRATLPLINLLPGVNPVKLVDWRRAVEQKMVQIHLDEGMYVELDARSLRDLADKRALDLVDLTVHVPLLREWLEKERRTKIREALIAQLAKIAPTKPKKGSDEDEEAEEE